MKTNTIKDRTLEEALIDLYLNLKAQENVLFIYIIFQ